jgi:dynein intermediate chain
MDLWNLNEQTEVPIIKSAIGGGKAINKLCWSPTGESILAGDSAGSILMTELPADLTQAKAEEWHRFEHTLAKLNQQRM